MAFVPSIILYASDGTTPVYTFENVIALPDWPNDNPDYVELKNKRGSGKIVIPGGDKDYKFRIRGVLTAANYTALTTAIFALKAAIVNNTHYVLKIEKSSGVYDSLNVQRLEPISWEGPENRVKIQYFTLTFDVLSWSA